ncbi:unnamed protein product [Paramecium pentaurelia]|uniref:Uncharacterized protein n=1 Tax=Paramecium pentaurelia TaxID=43138 RepID=A0A8S1X5S1_9CILI|nr:unnamed protein product [Paramecium pentaurelia]
MNGRIIKQQKIILVMFMDQVQTNNKIEWYLVVMINQYQQWNNKDVIKNRSQYKRLKFNNLQIEQVLLIIICSHYHKNKVYEMNSFNQQFTKTRDVDAKCGSFENCPFPQQYTNSKCILVSKNGQNISI